MMTPTIYMIIILLMRTILTDIKSIIITEVTFILFHYILFVEHDTDINISSFHTMTIFISTKFFTKSVHKTFFLLMIIRNSK